jgi:hypothetical protein
MIIRDQYLTDKISHSLKRFTQISLIMRIKSVKICEISSKKYLVHFTDCQIIE